MSMFSPEVAVAQVGATGGTAPGGSGGSGGSGTKSYTVGSRVNCNWWVNGGSQSGSQPSCGEGGMNTPMPCTITAVNDDGTFAIACDDGDCYFDAPLASMTGFRDEAGAAVPLTPLNASVGARVELSLDLSSVLPPDMPAQVRAGMLAQAAALEGEVDGALLGWRWNDGAPGHGDAPAPGFARVQMESHPLGQTDVPLDLVLLKTDSNKGTAPHPWCTGPHPGEWRDPGKFGWGTYCKTAPHEDGSVMCAHAGIVHHPHWSCCGSRVGAEDEVSLCYVPLLLVTFRTNPSHSCLTRSPVHTHIFDED